MKDILPQLDLNKENTNLRSADGLRPSEARPQVRSLGTRSQAWGSSGPGTKNIPKFSISTDVI